MDMLAETLMDFRGFVDNLALAKEIKRDGCYYNFMTRKR